MPNFDLTAATKFINLLLTKNSETSSALQSVQGKLLECEEAKADLEETIKDRVDSCNSLQNDLIGKCAQILNAKKRKIRALQQGK